MNFGGKEYKFAVILPWIGKVVRHYKLQMCLNVVLAVEHVVTGNRSNANTVAIYKECGTCNARREVAITSHSGVE